MRRKLSPIKSPKDWTVSDAIRLAEKLVLTQASTSATKAYNEAMKVMGRIADQNRHARMTAILTCAFGDPNTLQQHLYASGAPLQVAAAVAALVDRPGETLENRCKRIAADPVAAQVAIAVAEETVDPLKLQNLDRAEKIRLLNTAARTVTLLDGDRDWADTMATYAATLKAKRTRAGTVPGNGTSSTPVRRRKSA